MSGILLTIVILGSFLVGVFVGYVGRGIIRALVSKGEDAADKIGK